MFENEMEAGEEADLIPIKGLSHRIALTFGINVKTDGSRRAIIMIHRDSNAFSLMGTPTGKYGPSANIQFLEIVKRCVRHWCHAWHQEACESRRAVLAVLPHALPILGRRAPRTRLRRKTEMTTGE